MLDLLPMNHLVRRSRSCVGDIRSWLVLAFLIRLVGITDPPIEATHSWRQAFTNMVARNLAEGPFDLLHPRTDMAGERPDVVASEFPLFNAVVAATYRAFGPAHWYGRLWALLFSSAGIWAFHALVRPRFGHRVAFLAAFVLLWSSWFIYGRKSMPDTFSISLMLFALCSVDRTVRSGSILWILPAVVFAAAGGLSKIPAIVLLTPWALGVFDPRSDRRIRLTLGASFILAMIPILYWYFAWLPHLLVVYENPLFFPRSMPDGLAGLAQHAGKLFERFRFSALLSHIAALAMIAGCLFFLRGATRLAQFALYSSVLLFAYFMVRAGDVFTLHAYYILPLVPLMALLAGIGLARLPVGPWTTLVAIAVVLEGAGIRWNDLNDSGERRYLVGLEHIMASITQADDLVATSGDMDPRLMYFAHRHGWGLNAEQLLAPATLDSLEALGLRAVIVDRELVPQPLPWPVVYEGEHIRIYARERSDR